MTGWPLAFLAIALLAAPFGFGWFAAAASAEVARVIFFVFIALFAISLILRALRGGGRTDSTGW